jgi:hypothetical protein
MPKAVPKTERKLAFSTEYRLLWSPLPVDMCEPLALGFTLATSNEGDCAFAIAVSSRNAAP